MKKFDFWKDNKVDQHYQFSEEELRQRFDEWMHTREMKWLQYYNADAIISTFVAAGLSSVYEEKQYGDLYKILKPVYKDFVYPKEKA